MILRLKNTTSTLSVLGTYFEYFICIYYVYKHGTSTRDIIWFVIILPSIPWWIERLCVCSCVFRVLLRTETRQVYNHTILMTRTPPISYLPRHPNEGSHTRVHHILSLHRPHDLSIRHASSKKRRKEPAEQLDYKEEEGAITLDAIYLLFFHTVHTITIINIYYNTLQVLIFRPLWHGSASTT